MAPCCGEEEVGSVERTQIVIILIILVICAIIVIILICDNAGQEFEELCQFYDGFQGRKLLIKERKLVYKKVRIWQKIKPMPYIWFSSLLNKL